MNQSVISNQLFVTSHPITRKDQCHHTVWSITNIKRDITKIHSQKNIKHTTTFQKIHIFINNIFNIMDVNISSLFILI